MVTNTPLPEAPAPHTVLEAALYVDDLDAAARFYGGVLKLEEIVRVPDRHIFYRVGQTILLLFNPAVTARESANTTMPVPAHGAHGPGHFCFAATARELDQWHTRLTAAGHAVEADFTWPNGARSIYFRDPAGNSLEMAEPRLWSG